MLITTEIFANSDDDRWDHALFESLLDRHDWAETDIYNFSSWPRNTFIATLFLYDTNALVDNIQPNLENYPVLLMGYNIVPSNLSSHRRNPKLPVSIHAVLLLRTLGFNTTYPFLTALAKGDIDLGRQPYVGGGFVVNDEDQLLIHPAHSFRSTGGLERGLMKSFDRHSPIPLRSSSAWFANGTLNPNWDPSSEVPVGATINPLVRGDRPRFHSQRYVPQNAIRPYFFHLMELSGGNSTLRLSREGDLGYVDKYDEDFFMGAEDFVPYLERTMNEVNFDSLNRTNTYRPNITNQTFTYPTADSIFQGQFHFGTTDCLIAALLYCVFRHVRGDRRAAR